MTVIDSDAHVLETPRTWDFLRSNETKFRPMIVRNSDNGGDLSLQGNAISEYWVVDGKLHDKERNLDTNTTIEGPNRLVRYLRYVRYGTCTCTVRYVYVYGTCHPTPVHVMW